MTKITWTTVRGDEYHIFIHKPEAVRKIKQATTGCPRNGKYSPQFILDAVACGDIISMNVEGKTVVCISKSMIAKRGLSEEGFFKTLITKFYLYKVNRIDLGRMPFFWNSAHQAFLDFTPGNIQVKIEGLIE